MYSIAHLWLEQLCNYLLVFVQATRVVDYIKYTNEKAYRDINKSSLK